MNTSLSVRFDGKLLRKALVLACAAGISGMATAATETINPTYDAYATAGDTGSFTAELRVRDGSGGGNNQVRSYMKFDLSTIPEGSTINSASLKLYMYQAPTRTTGTGTVNVDQTYVLYKSSNTTWDNTNDCLYDGVGTCANPSAVPVSINLVSIPTGIVSNVDLTWTGANLQTAVQQSLDSVADNDWISLVVSDDVASQYRSLFDSNETATTAGDVNRKPRLIVDYTPPAEACEPGDEELRFTRNDYEGPNPIQWVDAFGDHWFTITFEVDAICADFTDIKVQGGLASNLKIWTYDPLVGSLDPKARGKGNQVLTWTIPSLAASDDPAQLIVDVSANFNEKGKAACGVKNLTGDWSAIGWWDDEGFPAMATDQVGQLVVDIGCPAP